MFVKLKNGLVDKYPYTLDDLKASYPTVSLPSPLTDDILATFGVFRVIATSPTYDPITEYPMEIQPVIQNSQWYQAWNILKYDAATAAQRLAESQASIEDIYVAAMEEMFDKTARTRHYDNRYTCALRAGYPGPFQAEGLKFAQWMDDCNEYGYQVMSDVMSGKRPLPTVEEFLSEIPTLTW